MGKTKTPAVPRIVSLRVKNYRVLRDIELRLEPLTVLVGPNGSGKSTVFDLFAFLSECFETNLRHAWERRGRAKELKSRGSTEPIVIEIKYREPGYPLITYHLSIDEREGKPIVFEEFLQWSRRGAQGRPFRFLEYREGRGRVISGERPEQEDERIEMPLKSPDLLAVNTLGQLAEHPRVVALREFITGWYVSFLSAEQARSLPEIGSEERLSKTGDNLANVIQFLAENQPERLKQIFVRLSQRVPRVEQVLTEVMTDGRLLLKFKDQPFEQPILARFASDGTIKMLAYLILLYDPTPPPFIGIEEPENHLHPRLLPGLAEECLIATERTQMLVTTHSPFFLNGIRDPKMVQLLWRDKDGFTRIHRVGDDPRVMELARKALLGDLWVEGFFGYGDPLETDGKPLPLPSPL